MGNAKSKSRFDELEQQHKELMKQNAEMAKRFADQEEANKRTHAAAVAQIAAMILLMAQAGANETVIQNEKREIEIEGTTYELVQFVNRGGFGEVHKAKVKNTNKMVAIKVMNNTPALQAELKNEINFMRLAKQIPIINHPIIEFYGSKVMKEGIFIAMELATCDLMSFWASKVSEGDPQEVAIIGMIVIVYVLRALTFLEKISIIHGDIKPQNLVIVPNDKHFCIKLIDFGTIEKMNTRVAQMTVEETKGFTLFFVSPEFLRRNAQNLICRHLHKKSDVWAAGVMFYFLFCGDLPWKDQHDYENFCNDRNARDIVIPDIGGYKIIIELLLKKNPDERSSAKATLLQLKAHPVFGKIVQSLHDNFGPVDDVCTMRVPNEVRQGLLKLARPGHVASEASSSASTTSGPRRSCQFGRGCRKLDDADHREAFAHQGDPDYRSPADADVGKRPCRYGSACHRKDDDHRQKFSHPSDSSKQDCRYGASCYDNDPDHRRKFNHPKSLGAATAGREECRFGHKCSKKGDREHMKKYSHD